MDPQRNRKLDAAYRTEVPEIQDVQGPKRVALNRIPRVASRQNMDQFGPSFWSERGGGCHTF